MKEQDIDDVVNFIKANLDPFLEKGGELWDRHLYVLEILERARDRFSNEDRSKKVNKCHKMSQNVTEKLGS